MTSSSRGILRIDGHDIRTSSIDAVTAPHVRLGGVSEGTDQIAVAQFDILINGEAITVTRSIRCGSGEQAGKAAVRDVTKDIEELREGLIGPLGIGA